MREELKKVLRKILSGTMLLTFMMVFLIIGVQVFGVKPYTISSSSMEPLYHRGSVIYVKKVNLLDVDVNDVIVFKVLGMKTATHRIVEIVRDEKTKSVVGFKTKGDANNSSDGNVVKGKDVIGVPVFSIPFLGYFIGWLKSQQGMCSAIVFVIVLISMDCLFNDNKSKYKAKHFKKMKYGFISIEGED